MAAEPATGIITDEELTRAAGTANSDPAIAERFLAAEAPQATGDGPHATDSDDTPARQWYGDSAYGTGDLRDAIASGRATSANSSRSGAGPSRALARAIELLSGTCQALRQRLAHASPSTSSRMTSS